MVDQLQDWTNGSANSAFHYALDKHTQDKMFSPCGLVSYILFGFLILWSQCQNLSLWNPWPLCWIPGRLTQMLPVILHLLFSILLSASSVDHEVLCFLNLYFQTSGGSVHGLSVLKIMLSGGCHLWLLTRPVSPTTELPVFLLPISTLQIRERHQHWLIN